MKEKDIKEELEHCLRSFLDAQERSGQESIDDFDELRILESAFSRLFISIEHLCNAVMLFEKGNFSKTHFGDSLKLKDLKERYKQDLSVIYQETYSFRSYGDYRKFPEIKEKFNREELKNKVTWAYQVIKDSLEVIGKEIDIVSIIEKLGPKDNNDPQTNEV